MQIELIKVHCVQIDLDYANEMVYSLIAEASKQDALLTLCPAQSILAGNELLHEQAHALRHLINFIDSLKKCSELKEKVAELKNNEALIQSMFL